MTVFIKDFDKNCECYLIGVEFEDKIMKVRPLDTEMWEDEVFEKVNYQKSGRTLIRLLDKLVDKKLVSRVGKNKGTKYSLSRV